MKKLLFLFAFVAFTFSVNAQSQVIKANPIGLAFGAFNACYEKVLNEKSSLLISGAYFNGGIGDIDVTSFGAGVGYRKYITKKEAPNGFYVQPTLSFGSGSEALTDVSYLQLGIGADLGYQWVWDGGFVLDLGIGPNYRIVLGDEASVGNGIGPSAVAAIGYAF